MTILNGVGVGLRPKHYPVFLRGGGAPARWVEVNAEKYLPDDSGKLDAHLQVLELVRERMPVVLHGTSMSLGSATEDNGAYLAKLKQLCDRIDPALVSDHLCWSGIHGVKLYDLLPVPFTAESVAVMSARIEAAQDFLGRTILVENLSSYVSLPGEMTEWEFVSEIVRTTGCDLLLDINNVFVSCSNHGWDPREYLRGIPNDRVRQIHLAGHVDYGHVKVDTHSEPVVDSVWELFRWYVGTYGPVATMIEWDSKIPPWPELARELGTIEAILDSVTDQEKRCA